MGEWIPDGPWRLTEHGEWIRKYRRDWQGTYCRRPQARQSFRWKIVRCA